MSCLYPHLFSPYTIKGKTFKNRIFASPVTVDNLSRDGAFTSDAVYAYGRRARGGFAQVTVTETYVDEDYAGRGINSLDVCSPDALRHMPSFAALTNAVRDHGAVASIQLNHVGAENHPATLGGRSPIGPSGCIRADGVRIQEMDEEMMERVADNFARSCFNVKALGFDMVMLHGGHGWLLAEFLSPLTNRRADKYGGSLENRARFPMLVLDRVRAAVGDDFLVEYRISGDERVEGGLRLDEAAEFCKMIQDKVDLLHVTSGLYRDHVATKAFSSMFDKHGCNAGLAAGIKKAVKIPVVSVGGFNDPALMDRVIAEGMCDFVAMGRQQLADPDFPRKAMLGLADEINPCLRCSCFAPMPADPSVRPKPTGRRSRMWSCAVNPKAGRERELDAYVKPLAARDVLVIGGGVAGMTAAAAAAERGHRVTLCEKTGRLGGLLWFTDADPHKEDLRRYRDALITKVHRRGVTVLLDTEATRDYVAAKNPDAVICCVGSEPVVPKIPGIEKARHALYGYSDFGSLGQRVVIIGGGMVGCEEALYLAEAGKTVHIVELLGGLARDAYESHRLALLPRLEKCAAWDLNAQCTAVTDFGVEVRLADGSVKSIEADTVLYAVGMKAKTDTVDGLRGAVDWFETAGDCVRARRVEEAGYEGLTAAMDVI